MEVIQTVSDGLPNEIVRFVKHCAEEADLTGCEVTKSGSGVKGDGYMGIVTFVTLKGFDPKGQRKAMHLVVKTAYSNEAIRKQMPINTIFVREITMYREVFPDFTRFQSEYNLNERFEAFAKCYYTSTEELNEVLVLQNIRETGHSLWDRQTPMNEEHVTLVLKEYAKFHAVSLAMYDQNHECFHKLTADLGEVFGDNVDLILPLHERNLDSCMKLFDEVKEVKQINALQNFKETLGDFYKLLGDHKDQYSVIIHGDCWCNNMMFKYEDKNAPKSPTKVCLIDFQLAKHGSLVLDLSYFFYACSSPEMLKDFRYYMEDVYYKTLERQLRSFGSDPEVLYPRSVFWEEWKRFGNYGFMFALMVCRLAMSDVDEVPDLAKAMENMDDLMNVMDSKPIRAQAAFDEKMRATVFHITDNKFM